MDEVPNTPTSLRCAVLAWDPNAREWGLLFANGDEAEARRCGAHWLEQNPEGECQLMVTAPNGRARLVRAVEWK